MAYRDDLVKFLRDPARRGRRATIGQYVFYLNPNSIDGNAVRSHLEYVTLNGGGSFRYPVMPEVWTMTGHTGIKGADELEVMYGALAPSNTRREVLLPFSYKPLFLHDLYVLINSFKRGANNSNPLYVQFSMEVIVMPRPRPPSFRNVSASVPGPQPIRTRPIP